MLQYPEVTGYGRMMGKPAFYWNKQAKQPLPKCKGHKPEVVHILLESFREWHRKEKKENATPIGVISTAVQDYGIIVGCF